VVTEVRPGTGPASDPGLRAPLPLGLWAIAVLLVIGGIAFLMGAAGSGPSFLSAGLIGLQASPGGRVALAVLAVAMIVAAVGILLRIRPAWGLTMLIVGIGLVVNLVAYIGGDPNYLRLAVFVVAAFYLNQRVVREVFLAPDSRRLDA
jgi:hypothetical protein